MTEKQNNRVNCLYCKESFNENAKICPHCAHHQKKHIQWFNQYINHVATFISIFFLVITFWQYREARKESIKAQEALVQAQEALMRAQKAEKKITESGKAIAKVLLALSTLNDSSDSFDVLKYFPGLMQSNSRLLLDAIEVSAEERQDIFEPYNKLKEWQQLPDSEQKENLGKEIEQLINR